MIVDHVALSQMEPSSSFRLTVKLSGFKALNLKDNTSSEKETFLQLWGYNVRISAPLECTLRLSDPLARIHKDGLFKSMDWNKHKIRVSCPYAWSLLDLIYCMYHAYFALILVHGLKINHRCEINHLCEFGPLILVVFLDFFQKYIKFSLPIEPSSLKVSAMDYWNASLLHTKNITFVKIHFNFWILFHTASWPAASSSLQLSILKSESMMTASTSKTACQLVKPSSKISTSNILNSKYHLLWCITYGQLWARRALMQFKDVPLRTRRGLSLYKVYGISALLVLNGTTLTPFRRYHWLFAMKGLN